MKRRSKVYAFSSISRPRSWMRRSTSSTTIGIAVVEHPRAQRFERRHALAAHVIGRVALDLVDLLEAGERGGEDHAGVVAQLVRSDQRSGSFVPLVVVL